MKTRLIIAVALASLPLLNVFEGSASSSRAGAQRPEGPPDATLTARSGTQSGNPGSFCWPEPAGEGICVDVDIRGRPATGLEIARGERVRFHILYPDAPLEVNVYVVPAREQVFLAPGTTSTWVVNVEPGRYHALLGAFWGDRDASWIFDIDVSPGLAETGPGPPGHPMLWMVLALAGLVGVLVSVRAARRSA